VARSAATLSVLSRCQRVATTNATVLLTGESGVGKDVFARQVHARSPRAAKPYIAINCAAIPETLLESTLFGFERGAFTGAVKPQEGKFESANGGTLFLDEIGELPIELQAKLLRVIQDRVVERIGSTKSQEVDVRIIAATNRDLMERVSAGKFREDLYYRLAVFPIAIPPLRERMEDVIPMAELFLERYGSTMGRPGLRLSLDAQAAISAYAWPGNVRELENAVQRALLLCDSEDIMPADLELKSAPPSTVNGLVATAANGKAVTGELPAWAMESSVVGANFALDLGGRPPDLETVEREHILRVLKTTDGNRKKAIDILGISERALRYKLKDYKEKGFYSDKD
jgi:two-component system response regulator FlrC